METKAVCPQCGASWQNGITCQEHFHQMLAWENVGGDTGIRVGLGYQE